MSGPISPDEVAALRQKTLPPEVFEAFNELIAEDFDGRSAIVMQNAVVARIMNKLDIESRQIIYNKKYLDVEEVYRQAGWKVEYDKPAYNESYEASFKFIKKQKMPNTFFASDHHLGHEKIIEFDHWDGTKIRPGFSCVDEMNEYFIDKHNSVVGPKDTCWFLGDVVINRRYLSLIERFNGRKRLVLGNHDIFKNKDYINAGFEDLHAFKKFDGFIATHIPVHRESLRASWGKNVHGHLHKNVVMKTVEVETTPCDYVIATFDKVEFPDQDYVNVCMEHLNDYTPISIDELRERF